MAPAQELEATTQTDETCSTVRVEPDGVGGAVVVLAGEMDQDCAAELREVLVCALSAYPQGLVLDLTAVTFCDCSGLNALLQARLDAGADRARRFRIRSMSPRVARLLALTGTLDYFPNDSGPGLHPAVGGAGHD
ncbi:MULTISPECIES: STAS domain-containing protein [unclassified Streptomyces]|uniref:STAS domain-containing protein n=1 Tax=unclassified Streptomyces TaxID=2593676 RepID=UPI0034302603